MESKINYTAVGAFVIALLTAIIIAIVWLSAGLSTEDYKSYLVYMNESVSGLSVDAPVKFNGVDVGSVKTITLNPKNPQRVRLLLDVKVGTPITNGTVATLSTQGLTGISYLGLKDTGNDKRPLRRPPGEPYPVIPTKPSLLLRLDIALTQLTTNLSQVSAHLNTLLDPTNQAAIKQTLINLNKLTTTLANNSQQLNGILKNTEKATQQFPALLRSGQNTMQTLSNQTLPATNQVINNLDSVTDNFLELSNELKQNPSIIIRGKTSQPLGPGEN